MSGRLACVALGALLAACSESDAPRIEVVPTRPVSEPEVTEPAESIGVAIMRGDGTIVLELRAEGGGAIGDGMVEYPPSDPQYQYVLDHLGGLRPGEEKPVPPFPD
jgi:hypothetical protein